MADPNSEWQIPLGNPQFVAKHLEAELVGAFRRLLQSGRYILGPEVEAFEKSVATCFDFPYTVAVSSGTDALLSTLMALNIGSGDEVITSPLTFIASAEAIIRVGARPVFADICPQCLCLMPTSVAEVLSPATRAILPVHLYGDLGHIEELATFAQEHELYLIEDACQALGSRLGRRHAGTYGIAGCFSFFPTKTLGGFGDSGLVCTDSAELAARIRAIRSHGRSSKHQFTQLGGNFRMDALHAALLSVLLRDIESHLTARRSIAHFYNVELSNISGVTIPQSCCNCESAWNVYTIRAARDRDSLVCHLNAMGIEVGLYYPHILPDHAAIARASRSCSNLGNARSAAQQVLSLPIFPALSADAKRCVTQCIREYFCTYSRTPDTPLPKPAVAVQS